MLFQNAFVNGQYKKSLIDITFKCLNVIMTSEAELMKYLVRLFFNFTSCKIIINGHPYLFPLNVVHCIIAISHIW